MANVSSSNGLEKRPKLRFPGFDKPWKVFKAEELFQNITDKNHPDETVLTIIQGKGTLPREQAGRNIHYDDASLSNYKKVEQGDFIIHLRSFEGGLEMANEAGIVSPAYTILRCKRPHSSLFYDAYFHTDEFINHNLSKSVEGIRDGRQISYEAFKWLGIPYCEPTEQEKISNLFAALNERIAKQRDLIEALKKYKRGLLSAVFSQNVSMFSTADFYAFSELAVRRSEKYDPKCNAHAVCIELEHIEQETGRIIGSTCADYQNSIKTVCKPGDVMFGKLRPYLRKYAFVQKECVCSSEIWSLIPTDIVIPKYLFYLIQSEAFMKAANVSSGTKMPRAEWSTIAKSGYPIPSKDDQQATVDILETTDRIIVSHVASYDRLIEYKKGLLQRLFI